MVRQIMNMAGKIMNMVWQIGNMAGISDEMATSETLFGKTENSDKY